MYASYGQSLYVATFHEPSIELSRTTAPEKRGFRHNSQHVGWPIHGSVPSFSPEPTNEAVGAKASIYRRHATRLTGDISPAYDRYFQYLLVGANTSVLNRHRRGLQPWRCRLSTYHSSTFPTSYLPFPPKGPARSQVIKQLVTIWLKGDHALNLVSGSLHSTSTITYNLSIAGANDVSPR
jgi:hypothetical protein